MMFIDSEISSSSIEVMPNGIGSELEGRPEILRMDQKNPQQPALPLNPHAEQQAEISHPASAAGQLPIEGLLESQGVTDRENKVADLICELRKEDGLRLPAPHRAPGNCRTIGTEWNSLYYSGF